MSPQERVYERLPSRLHSKLSVLTAEELDRELLYHISDNKRIREFHPVVSQRMLSGEDREVPRISTSSSLTGAIAGHDGTDHLFQSPHFDGLFKIYGLPFEVAVKPKASLVADGPQTGEYWLVAYSAETERYTPVDVGEFFYVKVSYLRVKHTVEVEWYLHVRHPDGMWLTRKRHLQPGHYRLTGISPRVVKRRSVTRQPMTLVSVDAISASDYRVEKKERGTASMEAQHQRQWCHW